MSDVPTRDPGQEMDLVAAYRLMLTMRSVEEQVLELRRAESFVGSTHVCVGQEVPPTAFVSVLGERDRVLGTYRGHGWALACGVSPYELFAEVLGRRTGVNGGRGGSAYLSAPAHRFVGENSIVGAGLPIANGVALADQHGGNGGVTVVSFGDGATNQGAAHEALVFAVARRLPVVFVCENNLWSEMTPIASTVPEVRLADRAAGYGMHAVQVDGLDVDHVATAAAHAVERARGGAGPAFVEVIVPRLLGHYSGDIEHYRDQADRAAHRARDPLPRLRQRLLDERVLTGDALARVEGEVAESVSAARRQALGDPDPDAATAREHVIGTSEIVPAPPLPTKGRDLTYARAVNKALERELEERGNTLVFGEDVAIPGGTFGATRGLHRQFGHRVFDTPISEAAILGAALGSSTQGMRPIVEIMWMDFLYVAFDQLLNQAANVRYLSRGTVTAPMVVRMQQGAAPGSCAQHSQSLEAILAHVPGIKVGMPSTPHDAYAMLRAAVADDDPVVIIESRELYQRRGVVDTEAPAEAASGARLRRPGSDALIISWGRMVDDALAATEQLAQRGVDAGVLDLRWLNPLDVESIGGALRLCGGKVVIVHEANLTGGFGAEIAARLAGTFFAGLDAPVRRVATPDSRIPASPVLRAALIPQVQDIVSAVAEIAAY